MVSPYEIVIKWNGQEFKTQQDPKAITGKDLYHEIHLLTGVPEDKMKVMGLKGLNTGQSMTLDELGLKNGQRLMVIGTRPGKEVVAPKEKTKFIEELTANERVELLQERGEEALPVGIENLGNTCYLNSVVQALRAVKPFKNKMIDMSKNSPNQAIISTHLADLFMKLEGEDSPPKPIALITLLRSKYPNFAKRDSSGAGFQQQDAEEYIQCIFQMIQEQHIKELPEDHINIIEKLFGFTMVTNMTIDEEGVVPLESDIPSPQVEHSIKLNVTMGESGDPTNFMQQGVERGLTSILERNVGSLGVNKKWKSVSRLGTLPKYLITHFIRFEWKRTAEGGTRAKVTRKIAYTRNFDVLDFCTTDLKNQLRPVRIINSDIEPYVPNEGNPTAFYPDGSYELISMVTHQGRTADSGHYVGWRQKYLDSVDSKDKDKWVKFDDEKVTDVNWSQIDLQGGRSDYHISYLNFWRRVDYKVEDAIYVAKMNELQEQDEKLKQALQQNKAE